MVVIEGVARLLPGVLGNPDSAAADSFGDGHTGEGLLEGPHYTRPPVYRGYAVPEVLRSGDHAAIARWRRAQALERTRLRRPDLVEDHPEQGRAGRGDREDDGET
jgi:tRNA (guanine37-N1)-methyltransferase